MRTLLIIGTVLFILSGCNGDRITKLEKENQELNARLAQLTASRNDDQTKCYAEARTFFEQRYKRDRSTIFLNYMNHFNRVENACYVLVEWRGDNPPLGWTGSTTLWNAQKNSRVGGIFDNHLPDGKERVSKCSVNGVPCQTFDEFNKLVQPFMNN
jgi:hypothetical protein